MRAVLHTTTQVGCPHCGTADAAVDHLGPGDVAGPWFCAACGRSYKVRVDALGELDVELREGQKIDTFDVLVLPPHPTPIYFLVPGMRFEGTRWRDPEVSPHEHKRFFYESHSCPTNWLQPDMILVDGDPDPHGFLTFVATRDASTFPADDHGRQEAQEAFLAHVSSTSSSSTNTQS